MKYFNKIKPYIAAGLGLAATGVSVSDFIKSKGYKAAVSEFADIVMLNKKVKVKLPDVPGKTIILINNINDIGEDSPLKNNFNKVHWVLLKKQIKIEVMEGGGPFVIKGNNNYYIIAHPNTQKPVIEHEVGHIIEGHLDRDYPFIMSNISRNNYNKNVMRPEIEAWSHAKDNKNKQKLEEAALATYDKGFYDTRAKMLLPAGYLSTAYGVGKIINRRR